MGKRIFRVMVKQEIVLELDDHVIDVVDDEWRQQLYRSLTTPEKIAAHIGRNIMVNGASLPQLDGWADQPESNAKVLWQDDEILDGPGEEPVELEAVENTVPGEYRWKEKEQK